MKLKLASAFILLLTWIHPTTAAEWVIVANESVPVENLKSVELRNIFLGKLTLWNNGVNVEPCYMETSELEDAFLENATGKTAAQFHSYWARKLFSGNGVPPKTFERASEITEFVADTKGAVCFASKDVEGDLEGAKLVAIN